MWLGDHGTTFFLMQVAIRGMCLDTARPRWNLGSAVETGDLNQGTTWPRPLLLKAPFRVLPGINESGKGEICVSDCSRLVRLMGN